MTSSGFGPAYECRAEGKERREISPMSTRRMEWRQKQGSRAGYGAVRTRRAAFRISRRRTGNGGGLRSVAAWLSARTALTEQRPPSEPVQLTYAFFASSSE